MNRMGIAVVASHVIGHGGGTLAQGSPSHANDATKAVATRSLTPRRPASACC